MHMNVATFAYMYTSVIYVHTYISHGPAHNPCVCTSRARPRHTCPSCHAKKVYIATPSYGSSLVVTCVSVPSHNKQAAASHDSGVHFAWGWDETSAGKLHPRAPMRVRIGVCQKHRAAWSMRTYSTSLRHECCT